MKLIALAVAIFLAASPIALACTSQTIFLPDGRMLVCQICGSMTTCF